ncbi:helix-turn-helix domain-containing protein [Pelagovum pacificum]|uniref:Helix-turn-helix domain-containing protein n=1 Tax=Pelagovum pacificum TaxID=2588711 RepID=A0A5C5GCB6_9RHOB|nr:helix-turn-helix domain-containing protein [Pelagovum pacificum]QQA44460.1 helix-turn-helix domain-containing protein [Pelagovum pacificum]TNY32425.1 helix-turn-helix domain-containing protein [Pelagovum pacificum]
MNDFQIHMPQDVDDDMPSTAFFVESHLADAMPLPHWHDHVEVNLLPEGRMDYLIGGRRVELRAGRLAVFWAAIHHQVVTVEPSQRLFCAYVPVNLFLSLPLAPGFRSAVLRGELLQAEAADPSDEARMAEMVSDWTKVPAAMHLIWRDEILLRLRRMSFQTVTAPASPTGARGAGPRSVWHVERMTAFVNDNLGRAITVGEVAAASGLHPTTARAAFRKVLGFGIAEYIRRQRLGLAMRLLAETDLGPAEVAHMAGYGSMTRLYDAFRELTGKTPRTFRAELRGGRLA